MPAAEGGLGAIVIVIVPPVVDASSRGVLVAREPFARFTTAGLSWADGTTMGSGCGHLVHRISPDALASGAPRHHQERSDTSQRDARR